ncbi:MAG: hypothetical protein ACON5H_06985 [Akkermansiaceae bacterium]
MKFKAFIFGLLATFGLPWLFAIVIPFSMMRGLEPVKIEESEETYIFGRAGRVDEGSLIYGQEGCYYCHSQLIRPTTFGKDTWRADWAGLPKNIEEGRERDTRRETLPTDFDGEKFAHTGLMRVGPDLSNLGRRLEQPSTLKHLAAPGLSPESWLYHHLYNPRGVDGFREGNDDLEENSACPSKKGLFTELEGSAVRAAMIKAKNGEGDLVYLAPTDRARALVSYLLSLKKDTLSQPIPKEYNFSKVEEK